MRVFARVALVAAFTLLVHPGSAHCAELKGVSPIGSGARFACWESSSGPILLKMTRRGIVVPVSFEVTLERLERRIRRLQRKLRRFSGRSRGRARRKINRVQRLIRDIRLCRGNTSGQSGGSSPVDACGVVASSGSTSGSRQDAQHRIINGDSCAGPRSSTVLLILRDAKGSPFSACSGTVIHRQAVLTAAHCLDGAVAAVDVYVGLEAYRAKFFKAHPGFGAYPLESNDMGVVIVTKDLPTNISSYLRNSSAKNGELAVIAGFGYDEFGQLGDLRAAPVVIDRSTTSSLGTSYSGISEYGNTCSGDSGGPLFVQRDNEWVVAGVTSNGRRHDCGPGDIARYANITDPENQAFLKLYLPRD